VLRLQPERQAVEGSGFSWADPIKLASLIEYHCVLPAAADGAGFMTRRQLEHLTTALAGRYRIVREIGRGGMATVYLAGRSQAPSSGAAL
jgi:hypothetical protein